jgi:adenosine deaminase
MFAATGCWEVDAMSQMITREFIDRIPKTDLHLHLDGSLRLETLIELARQEGVDLPSYEEQGLRELVFKEQYESLVDYLQGFAYTCAVLRGVENIERIAYELAEDNIAENVRYIEVRFAPQLHIHDDLSMKDVFMAVAKGLERAKKTHNARPEVMSGNDLPFEYGIIACAMRSFNEHMSPYYARLIGVLPSTPHKEILAAASVEMARAAVELRDSENLPIVGFDLAGEEYGYPASYHTSAYQYAHTHFLNKTVHAGEAYGPESIFQAITDCHASRIGHGTFLFCEDMIKNPEVKDRERFVTQLAEYIAARRITIEVCLTSNLQTTPDITSVEKHPLAQMLAHNFSITICTDNRLVSGTTPADELELMVKHLPVTRHQFRNIVIAGYKGSFFPGTYNHKRAYVRRFIDLFEQLEHELLPADHRSTNPSCGENLSVE